MYKGQRGQALISAIIGVALVVLVLLTTLSVTQYSHKAVARQLNYQGLALNAATAGLNEGLSWFRRQTAQPVTSFTPAATTTGPPPVNDSDDSTIGLVRNYTISSLLNVNGSYTLKKTGGTTNTIDVTALHGKTGAGVIWQLESEGVITAPTTGLVISKATLRAEIQRLGLNMPAAAALTVSRNNCINTGAMTDCKVRGGSSGVAIAYVPQPSGTAPSGWPVSGTTVVDGTGTTASFAASPDRFAIPYMFDMTQTELTRMANYSVTDCSMGNGTNTGPSTALNTSVLPNPMPSQMSMTIINCTSGGTNVTFNNVRPLGGSGIVYIVGNVTLADNMNSTFNGILYVNGTFSTGAGCVINGQVIVNAGTSGVTQTVNINGLPGNFAEIRYDPIVLTEVAQQIGTYNFSRTPYVP